MSQYDYLGQAVRGQVQDQVKKVLQEIACIEPPLSLSDVLDYAKLKTQTFSRNDPNFLDLVKEIGADAESLRGCLFVPDKLIVARDDGYAKRMNFVLAHELGHYRLPWHQALLYKCTQFDLSVNARTQLEREANFFASELCFMGDEFTQRLEAGDISLKALSALSDQFNMSRESTLRRAVEISSKPCVFVIMTHNPISTDSFLTIRYITHSDPYTSTYGVINHDQTFTRNHLFAKVHTDPIAALNNYYEGEIHTRNDKLALRFEGWKNKWNTFALLSPLQPK